mmetsp:Transcript_106873/g.299272  ORF Transcript_106873/g.299272 Transcript_106873/m.299272 type:complete len:215 (-) Transcript_106873:302-946(-)
MRKTPGARRLHRLAHRCGLAAGGGGPAVDGGLSGRSPAAFQGGRAPPPHRRGPGRRPHRGAPPADLPRRLAGEVRQREAAVVHRHLREGVAAAGGDRGDVHARLPRGRPCVLEERPLALAPRQLPRPSHDRRAAAGGLRRGRRRGDLVRRVAVAPRRGQGLGARRRPPAARVPQRRLREDAPGQHPAAPRDRGGAPCHRPDAVAGLPRGRAAAE